MDEPAVDPATYDEQYYLTCCVGSAEWAASGGSAHHGIYNLYSERLAIQPGEVLVDVGAGRGEMLILAAERGAKRAVGIEYSPAAVDLARKTLAAHGDPDGVEILLADARAIPLPDSCADAVTLFDVVEHLTPDELATALGEARRLLRPGGRLMIHTMPNRRYYDWTYRAMRLFHPSWPRDPRLPEEHEMHVNEQTLQSLRRALRAASFDDVSVWYGEWVHDRILPKGRARGLVRRMASHRATRGLAAFDLWATARR